MHFGSTMCESSSPRFHPVLWPRGWFRHRIEKKWEGCSRTSRPAPERVARSALCRIQPYVGWWRRCDGASARRRPERNQLDGAAMVGEGRRGRERLRLPWRGVRLVENAQDAVVELLGHIRRRGPARGGAVGDV